MDTRLDTDPDFVLLKRFGYSLKRVLERYPDIVPDDIIAQALGITAPEVEFRYLGIVRALRGKVG
jgi:hypothetical protein